MCTCPPAQSLTGKHEEEGDREGETPNYDPRKKWLKRTDTFLKWRLRQAFKSPDLGQRLSPRRPRGSLCDLTLHSPSHLDTYGWVRWHPTPTRRVQMGLLNTQVCPKPQRLEAHIFSGPPSLFPHKDSTWRWHGSVLKISAAYISPTTAFCRRYYCYYCFIEEGIEARKDEETCLTQPSNRCQGSRWGNGASRVYCANPFF